ncbi:hypothetical protein BT96DRAFT_940855 [Gymnopus androsaceus JB14]|uniref:Ribonuclease H1 N-terminal domain-containing protein n=1 Tax=Gymnopus androsaceus JB14 TaxID=1447944 RepID=A0A6A4HKL6_9AGAR|nr:hypothetical protein BT96DRAFT_940855 [Gymnopus androsaceus JB14]
MSGRLSNRFNNLKIARAASVLEDTKERSPVKNSRVAALDNMVKDTEDLVDFEEDLQFAELDLALAQATYSQASQRLVTKLDHAEANLAQLRATVSPPGSPSRRQNVSSQALAATPMTPTHKHAGLRFQSPAASDKVSGQVPFVQGALYTAVKPEPDVKAPNTPAAQSSFRKKVGKLYVVYFRINGQQGVFESWNEAEKLCRGYPDAIQQSFNDHELGRRAFNDWNQYRTSEALMESSAQEKFIVVVGKQPGVYSRKGLAKFGLGWRGGQVARFDSSWDNAHELFEQFTEAGTVRQRSRWVHN